MKVEDRSNAVERELGEIRATLSTSKSPQILSSKEYGKDCESAKNDTDGAKSSLFKNVSE